MPLRLIASARAVAVVVRSVMKSTAPKGMMLNVPTFSVLTEPDEPESVIVADAGVSATYVVEAMDTRPSNVPVAAASAVAGCAPE